MVVGVRVLLDLLDVTDGETIEKVHDDNHHEEQEDDKDEREGEDRLKKTQELLEWYRNAYDSQVVEREKTSDELASVMKEIEDGQAALEQIRAREAAKKLKV